uniref:Uncharacterized protein n=1 Tax=Panagrolaimus davidi TaxID=227884 RepID=A0A914QHX2_9BILA
MESLEIYDRAVGPNNAEGMQKLECASPFGKVKKLEEQEQYTVTPVITRAGENETISGNDSAWGNVKYTFEEEARVRDLVNFAADNYAFGDTYMFQWKWKTLDITGIPKITTILLSSLFTHGKTGAAAF